MSTKNLHSGHRRRMRDRFISSSRELTSVSDHEVIEMLLYNSCRRGNTNETAHELINRFGSISGVLGAEEDELCRIRGVGPQTARFLKLCNALMASIYGDSSRADRAPET